MTTSIKESLESFDTSKYDSVVFTTNPYAALEFKSQYPAEQKNFFSFPESISQKFAKWLDVDTSFNFDAVRSDIYDSLRKMYYGSDTNGAHTLGLRDISNWKKNADHYLTNIKQHAGYAAEVLSTTKENLLAISKGTGITTSRADDLPDLFKKNDQYVDKVRRDAHGNILERIQTKFVGKSGESCLAKLMSKDFEKYILDGKVDKIEIPKDYYQEIRSNNLIENKLTHYYEQLSRIQDDPAKAEAVQNLEANIAKLKKLDSMLEESTVSMREAIDSVLDPQSTVKKLFSKESLALGAKSTLITTGITLTVSTVENVSEFIDGKIKVDEMIKDIVSETAIAGAIDIGSELISGSVSAVMLKSSVKLLNTIAKSGIPSAVVSFAVESYDSISAYAKGEICTSTLAYELGDAAASVAGAAIGGNLGSVRGFSGALVGSFVGAAVASEIYATAVEIGADGVEMLAEKAESLAQTTVELFEEHLPDKLDDVKNAFTEFFNTNNLPFSL